MDGRQLQCHVYEGNGKVLLSEVGERVCQLLLLLGERYSCYYCAAAMRPLALFIRFSLVATRTLRNQL